MTFLCMNQSMVNELRSMTPDLICCGPHEQTDYRANVLYYVVHQYPNMDNPFEHSFTTPYSLYVLGLYSELTGKMKLHSTPTSLQSHNENMPH